jgi:hypothetical protein
VRDAARAQLGAVMTGGRRGRRGLRHGRRVAVTTTARSAAVSRVAPSRAGSPAAGGERRRGGEGDGDERSAGGRPRAARAAVEPGQTGHGTSWGMGRAAPSLRSGAGYRAAGRAPGRPPRDLA